MGTTFGGTIKLSGEKEYQAALQNIANKLKLTDSEMRKLTEQSKNNADSVELLKNKGEVLAKQYKVQEDKIKIYQNALEKATEEEKKAANHVSELKNKLESATQKMKDMEKSSSASTEEIEKQKEEINKLSKQLGNAEIYYTKTTNTTMKWQASLNDARTNLSKSEREIKNNNAALQKAEENINDTSNATEDYAKSVNKASKETISFGTIVKANLVSDVISAGIRKASDELKNMTQFSVQAGTDFEYGMAKVRSISGATGDDFEALKLKAKEMGATTKFSATESAEAMNYMAMAGWKTEDMLEGISGIMDLAAASGEDLATTSDIVTDALTAFGLSAKDSGHFSDILAKASSNANTNVSMMGDTFKYAAPVAGAMGYSAEDTAVAIGLMANSGIKASQAGTALRGTLTNLAKPSKTVSAAMDRLDISLTDSSGKMKPLNQLMLELRDRFSSLSEAQKTQEAASLAGKEAMSGLLAIVNASDSDFNKLTESIQNCDGATADMAEILNDTLKGRMYEVQSAAEAVGITFFEKFETPLKDAAVHGATALSTLNYELQNGKLGDSVDRLAESFSDAATSVIDFGIDALPTMIDGLSWVLDHGSEIISVVGGIGIAVESMKVAETVTEGIVAWKAYKAANEGATVAQWALNGAMSANPIGLLAAGVAGLVGGLAIYNATQSKISDETLAILDKTQDSVLKSEEIVKQTENSISKRKDNIRGIETEYAAIGELSNRVFDLAEKEKLTNKEKAEMDALVSELNKSVPDLGLAIDEETGKLNKNRSETEALLSAKIGYYKAQAYQESFLEIGKNLIDLERNLKDIRKEREEVDKELAQVEQDHSEAVHNSVQSITSYSDAMGKTTISAFDMNTQLETAVKTHSKTSEEVEKLKEQQAELNRQEEETVDAIKKANQQYDEGVAYLATYNSAVKDSSTGIQENVGEMIAWKDQTKQVTSSNAEAWSEIIEKYDKTLESAKESIRGQLGLFDEYEEAQKTTAAEMIKNLESQINASKNWKSNIEELHGHVSETILRELESMGVSSAGYVQGLVDSLRAGGDGAGTELDRINQLFNEKLSLEEPIAEMMADAQGGFSELFNSMNEVVAPKAEETGQKIGNGLGTGTIGGIESMTPILSGKMALSVTDAADASSSTASKKGEEIGSLIIGNAATGVQSSNFTLLENVVSGVNTATDAGNVIAARGSEVGTTLMNNQIAAVQIKNPELSTTVTDGIHNAVGSSNAAAEQFFFVGQTGANATQSGWNFTFPNVKNAVASDFDNTLLESEGKMQSMHRVGDIGGTRLRSGWIGQQPATISAVDVTGKMMLNSASRTAINMGLQGEIAGRKQAIGYSSQNGLLVGTVQNSAQSMLNAANSFSGRYPGIGSSYAEGISVGWDSRWGGIVSKVHSNLIYLHQKAKEALSIASPSKKSIKMGNFYGQGFEIGSVRSLKAAGVSIEKELKYSLTNAQKTIDTTPIALGLETSKLNQTDLIKGIQSDAYTEIQGVIQYKVQNEARYKQEDTINILKQVENALLDFNNKQIECEIILDDGTLVGKMMPKIRKNLNDSSFKSFIAKTAMNSITNRTIATSRSRGM